MSGMKPVAVVGLGAILPDAFDVPTFWENIKTGRYSISEVPSNRWSAELYYNPDPLVPDKTYSKIGGWVKDYKFEPFKWGVAIPPKVIQQMDEAQQWAIEAARQALMDYGYPQRKLEPNRVAVILGNALGGERHYNSTMRIRVPEFVEALRAVPQFQHLPREVQTALIEGMRTNIQANIPDITEDTMPGELSNIIAGRVANIFNFQGPNFTTDAACASSLAALQAAVEGLNDYQFDAVITGGVDRMMGVEGFVKFSKIGALSPDGSRPYADGANGFVMGEGAAVYLLKRLEDAERDGDRIYAVFRGVGSSSDGKGKGITAPNPTGQQQALERAWKNADLHPATAGLIEGHGTSTRVGDVVEVTSLNTIFGQFDIPAGRIALGSVKSNIGHLKSAAGAAGVLKVILSLSDKVLPPSVNFHRPNPNIDFEHLPFYVNTTLKPWEVKKGEVRRAGVSSFGFGGTNFHVVLDEYIPGLLAAEKPVFAGVTLAGAAAEPQAEPAAEPVLAASEKADVVKPYRGLYFNSADTVQELRDGLSAVIEAVKAGAEPPSLVPNASQLAKNERIAIDYGDREEFLKRAERALKGFDAEGNPWTALVAHGVFRGSGKAGKVAFLFPGQGSQYVNMLKDLCEVEPIAAKTFAEADRVMEPILGRPLTSFIYVDGDEAAIAEAEKALRNTEITQPAMLTANVALLRLMERFGFEPDMVIGHSLGEYAALVAAGVMTFPEALEVVSARGQEMKKVSWDDNGCMAAVSAPIERVAEILKGIDGYVVIANINSPLQSVIGGTTEGVDKALAAVAEAGYQGTKIPVSHAFHTKIVAPASEPLRKVIERMNIQAPKRMIVANVTGEIYPNTREEILDILARQVASPVQFVKGMQTLYDNGARVFAEIGPKRVLNALATDNLKGKADVMILATNHPREGAVVSFNKALCGLYAAGIGPKAAAAAPASDTTAVVDTGQVKQFVLGLVSEKTGYPAEMLDLDLDLEADLGIDTVKQAELFAAVRTHYGIPRREDLRLSDYNTLSKVIGFVTEALAKSGISAAPVAQAVPEAEKAAAASPAAASAAPVGVDRDAVKQFVMNLVSEKTGYPAEMLDLELDLEADLGIDTVKQAELFAAVRTHYGIPRREDLRLSDYNTLDKVIGFVVSAASSGHVPQTSATPAASKSAEMFVPAAVVGSDPVPAPVPVPVQEPARHTGFPLIKDGRLPLTGSVVISGAGLGLPGRNGHVFEAGNVESILNGEVRIEPFPDSTRQSMLEKRVTRLIKSDAGAVMQMIDQLDQTVKLAGIRGEFDLANEFGVPEDRVSATDISTQLAIAAGIDALRDAGIPLVMSYKQTSKGTLLPDRWKLPEALADETGVIFGSAFPGLDQMASEVTQYHRYNSLLKQADELRAMLVLVPDQQTELRNAIEARIRELSAQAESVSYTFDRRFIFRILTMGHSQFAEHIGARGPNTHVNAACATTTHAIAVAEDWIRMGRARRVIVIAGDDITSGELVNWVGTGLMASGAATIEGNPRMAILPFDRRRNGMIMGMGGAALVVESEDAVRERGMRGIAEVLSTVIANSAFHGTRLDVDHVADVMNRLVSVAESRYGIRREQIASKTVFVSHETYTPARGGSAAAEIRALRHTFGDQANRVVIANTKGYTGHTMGVGVEDVVALKALETGKVPPIANIHEGFEPDPDLGDLNLSKGGDYQPQYSLRLGAGFGSQIAMTLMRKVESQGERVNRETYRRWLEEISGYIAPELEVERHTLRVRHEGAPVRPVRKSLWEYGQGPTAWATDVPDTTAAQTQAAIQAAVVPPPPPISAPMVSPSSMPAVLNNAVPLETPAAVGGETADQIKGFVLNLVSEKTGYPQDMLDLDLDLEADLGIDTVKQAELFAAVRTNYGIPRREDLRLSDYNTLKKVIGFVSDALRNTTVLSQNPVPVQSGAAQTAGVQAQTPPVVSGGDSEEIKTYVLNLVSEKTGYPQDMLDLDLDLEADLGIDTVKQAELFAAVRTNYGIPRREDLRLSDYNTLKKVIGFVSDALAAMKPVDQVSTLESAEPVSETSGTGSPVQATQEWIEYPRRVPELVLRPRLDLCVSTGIELGEQSRVVVISGRGKAGDVLARRLRSRKVQVLVVSALKMDAITDAVTAFSADGPVQGVYFLPGLDQEPDLIQMDEAEFQSRLDQRTLTLYWTLKAIPGEPFVISATRMGGLHGFGPGGALSPMGGAVAGLTKAIGMERSGCLVKVVDFEKTTADSLIAARLIAETINDPGIVEVGWENDLRYTLNLAEKPGGREAQPLPEGSVFVVTGGSGGITGPVMLDLARATHGMFYLLSRTVLPARGDPDLARLRNDRNGLKAELMRRLMEKGEKATPAVVEQKIAALERAAQTLDTIETIESTGAKAVYMPCDITDAGSVNAAIDEILARSGKVDVVIHAAGVERSRKIETKSEDEFRQTLRVKALGFYHVFVSLAKRGAVPKFAVLFSSVAGRFGNTGQSDYSAANDYLARLASHLNGLMPDLRVVALDWGAWSEVGMASRGFIPELMKRAGIEMMQPASAARLVRRELETGSDAEVVLAGSLGLLEQPRRADGGLDIEKANSALTAGKPIHTMLTRVSGLNLVEGVILEAELDPAQEPFLRDHAMNGIPLLPGVMGIEGLSTAARHVSSVLASEKGSFQVKRIEDVEFLAPFKFYRGEKRVVTWKANVLRKDYGLVAEVLLESSIKRYGREPETMRHFTGKVYLEPVGQMPEVKQETPPHWNGQQTLGSDDIYRLYFHGPAFQVLEGVQRNGEVVLGKLRENQPMITSQNHTLVTAPVLVELCLQTAGVWEIGTTGSLALPSRIGTLRLYQREPVDGAIFAEVQPHKDDAGSLTFNARVVDSNGRVYLELENYRTQPLPYSVEQKLLAPVKDWLKDQE